MGAQRVEATDASTATMESGEGALAGIPYRHEWLLASELEIDHRYQRPLRMAWVRKIAAEFDPFLLDDLLVNRTAEGQQFVMDGQHRLFGIRHMGWNDQRVPCKVYDNLPDALQAKRFNVQKNRLSLKPQEEFKAALVAGDPDAVAIEATVRAHGYRVNLTDGDLDGGQIAAVSALRTVSRSGRMGALGEVLGLLRDGFGTAEGPRHMVIAGVASFASRFRGRYDRARLIEVMRRTSVNRVAADGGDAARVLGLKTAEGVAFALWKGYNHRLSDDRKLPDFATADGRRAHRAG